MTTMPREILFRGFHEEENGSTTIIVDGKEVQGEWVYGDYVKFCTNKENSATYYIQRLQEDESLDIVQEVIPSTIGQYTGVDDKNGIRIWEGSRCRITRDCILVNGYIKFKTGSFYFKENYGETVINLSDLAYNNYKIEVTGTMFNKKYAEQASWIKLPPLVVTDPEEPFFKTQYDNAPSDVAPMYMRIYMAFGKAVVTKNDNIIYDADKTRIEVENNYWTTKTAEQYASREPNNDWRISLQAPLSDRTYQRQGENLWVLVEENIGFA